MKRTRITSRRRAWWKRILSNPFTPVLIGLALVLGVGFWAMRGTPAADGDPPSDRTVAGRTDTGGGAAEPAATPGGATKEETPGETPAKSPSGTPEDRSEVVSGRTPDEASTETTAETPAETPAESLADTPPDTQDEAGAPASSPGAADAALVARGQIDRSGGASETMLITAYFADGLQQGTSLQPVEMKVPFDIARIKATAAQIVNPPQELGLYSSIPAGTQVLETNLKDGVAIVNLSAALEEVQGTAAVNNIRASFVYSLTSIPGVEAVQLWTEGRPAVLDGYEWSRPVTRAEIESEGLYAVQALIPYAGP